MPDLSDKTQQTFERGASELIRGTHRTITSLISGMVIGFQKAFREGYLSVGGETSKKTLEKVAGGSLDSNRIHSINVADEDYKSYLKDLDKAGVLYYVEDIINDDAKKIFFPAIQRDLVKDILDVRTAEQGLTHEVRPEAYLRMNKGNALETVGGLSSEAVELFRYHAKDNKLDYSIVRDKKNETFTIMTKEANYQKFKLCLSKVSNDIKDPLIMEQVAYKIKGKQEINIALKDAKREYYIVSGSNPQNYIHVTANDFEYYKYNNLVTKADRVDEIFTKELNTKIDGLLNPVVLSKDEFELEKTEKQELIDHKINSLNKLLDNKEYPEDTRNIYKINEVRTNKKSELDDVIRQAKKQAAMNSQNREQSYTNGKDKHELD